jgi:hypothetical protein
MIIVIQLIQGVQKAFWLATEFTCIPSFYPRGGAGAQYQTHDHCVQLVVVKGTEATKGLVSLP